MRRRITLSEGDKAISHVSNPNEDHQPSFSPSTFVLTAISGIGKPPSESPRTEASPISAASLTLATSRVAQVFAVSASYGD